MKLERAAAPVSNLQLKGTAMKIAVVGANPPTFSDYVTELRNENASLKAEVTSLRSTQQTNTAIALAERYKSPFSSEGDISKVMAGFIVWLQEQQQNRESAPCCQAVRLLNKTHCGHCVTWRCPVCHKEIPST